MTNNRPIKKLWEIGTFIRWITYHKQELLPSYVDWCVTLLRSNNIQNELNLNELQYLPKRLITEEKIVKKWDVLFCMSNWSKDLVWKNIILPDLKDYSFGAFCSIFRPKTSESSIYIKYFLRSSFYKDYIYWLSRWIGINNLRNSDLEVLEIPLPPLDIQKAIVAKLDEAFTEIDEAIATTQANIEKTNETTKSVLDKVFEEWEWEKVKLREVITLNYGKGLDKKERSEHGLYNVYGANWVLAKSDKYLIEWESIIVWRKGSAWALTRINWKFRPTDVTYYVTFNKKWNMDYIYLALKRLNLESLAQWVKPWINRNEVYDLEIPLPSLAKQQEIVKYLDEVFAHTKEIKFDYEAKLEKLKELKASILQSAFEGKLI